MQRLFWLAVIALASLPSFSQSVSFNPIKLGQDLGPIVGDFNGDGREDMIIFTPTNFDTFHLQISTGTGTYTAGPTYPVPGGGRSGGDVEADFNNDGKLDVVLISVDGSAIYFLRGNGNGTLQAPIKSSTGLTSGGRAVAADVNHDGKMDLVVTSIGNQSTTIATFLGNGNGTFTAGPQTQVAMELRGLFTGDFDGDGKVDLISISDATNNTSNLNVYYGDGTGNFGSPFSARLPDQSNIAIADVDGDGKSDIITSTSNFQPAPQGSVPIDEPRLTVFYGAADRTLQSATIATSQCTSFGRPVVADFNGDHIPDIIFFQHTCGPNGSAAEVTFIPGNGGRTFGAEQTIFNTMYNQSPGSYSDVARANNSDTKPDFLFTQREQTTHEDGPEWYAMVNTSSGTFAKCNAPNSVAGFRICSPASGSTVASPVNFSIGAAGSVPMRKVEVWADGVKQVENLYAFSHYAFLDASIPLSPGTHAISIIATGWDNSLQSKALSITVQGSGGGGGGGCTSGNSITVCSPVANSQVSSPIHVQASTTLGSPTYRFELWDGSTKLFTVRDGNSMDTTISLSAGSHKLAFVAKLANGTRRELDVNVTVK